MNPYLPPLIAGVLGTLAMSALLLLPAQLGLTRVDVIRAAGAYVTKDRETAFMPGMALHLGAGIFFAYCYAFAFAFVGAPLNAATGMFAGVVHGIVVMMIVVIAVLEHHPLERYHSRSPMTGLSQVLGHAIYGLVVGAVCHALAPMPLLHLASAAN